MQNRPFTRLRPAVWPGNPPLHGGGQDTARWLDLPVPGVRSTWWQVWGDFIPLGIIHREVPFVNRTWPPIFVRFAQKQRRFCRLRAVRCLAEGSSDRQALLVDFLVTLLGKPTERLQICSIFTQRVPINAKNGNKFIFSPKARFFCATNQNPPPYRRHSAAKKGKKAPTKGKNAFCGCIKNQNAARICKVLKITSCFIPPAPR